MDNNNSVNDNSLNGLCNTLKSLIDQFPQLPAVIDAEKRTRIYFMRHKNGQTKIGKSKNPRAREKTLQAEDPELKLIWISGETTSASEKWFHGRFAEKRERGEWFSVTDSELVMGVTEWLVDIFRNPIITDNDSYVYRLWVSKTGHGLGRFERTKLDAKVEMFGSNLVCKAMNIAIERYNTPSQALKKIGGICFNLEQENPSEKNVTFNIEWVPIKERAPDNCDYYLFAVDGFVGFASFDFVGWLDGKELFEFRTIESRNSILNITHWAELPDVPDFHFHETQCIGRGFLADGTLIETTEEISIEGLSQSGEKVVKGWPDSIKLFNNS